MWLLQDLSARAVSIRTIIAAGVGSRRALLGFSPGHHRGRLLILATALPAHAVPATSLGPELCIGPSSSASLVCQRPLQACCASSPIPPARVGQNFLFSSCRSPCARSSRRTIHPSAPPKRQVPCSARS